METAAYSDLTQLLQNWQGLLARMGSFSPLVLLGQDQVPQALPLLQEHGLDPDYVLEMRPGKVRPRTCGIQTLTTESLRTLPKSAGICVCSLGGLELAQELQKHARCPVLDAFLPLAHEQFAGHFDPRIIAENLQHVRAARSLFADEPSRDLYDRLLAFRLTCDLRLLPLSDIPLYHYPATAPRQGDVVIDGGAYDGCTALDFAAATGNRIRIFSFEPDRMNLAALRQNIRKSALEAIVEAVPMALWRADEDLTFSGAGSSARMDPGGGSPVRAVSLDSFCATRRIEPSLIKTDLEGADIEALRGARATIARHTPRLALSVYHRPEDLWEIPLLANKLRPGSDFHLVRHRGPEALAEVVCYVA